MAFIPAPNTVQAELIINCNSQIVENVFHYRNTDAWTIIEMNGLGGLLVSWWSANMRPLVHSATILTAIRLTDLRTSISPVVVYNTGLPLVGTGAGPSLPNSVSTVITKRTPLRGRSYRGRIYQYGMMETQMDGDLINGAVTTSLINAYEDIKDIVVGTYTFDMVVVSRRQNGVDLTEAVTTPVFNFSSDGVVDSQRRRLRGRGK